MTFECDYEGCEREFDTKQGLGQHVSAAHEGDEQYKDRPQLRELYIDEGLTSREIAERFGISKSTVLDWLDRFDIEKRPSKRDMVPNFRTTVGGYEEVRTVSDGDRHHVLVHRLLGVAEFGFDDVAGADVHHENGIPWDNRPENLSPMSRSDHLSHHHDEGTYDDHLKEVHQHRHDSGRFSSFKEGNA
jgi:transposase-like protein